MGGNGAASHPGVAAGWVAETRHWQHPLLKAPEHTFPSLRIPRRRYRNRLPDLCPVPKISTRRANLFWVAIYFRLWAISLFSTQGDG